jgi:hypothetical protein
VGWSGKIRRFAGKSWPGLSSLARPTVRTSVPVNTPRIVQAVALLTLSTPACSGDVGKPLGPGDTFVTAGGAAGKPAGTGDFATGNFDPSQCAADPAPGAMPGLVRLTHRQYGYAVRDLLDLDARASEDFVADQEVFGFDNNAESLSVPENQVRRYQATAERLAGEAAADLSKIARVVPCVASDASAACGEQFVAGFLELMFRRPLSSDEQSQYRSLFAAGNALYEEGTSFQRGVRIVLEAALQSPSFVYRAEVGDTPLDGAVRALDDYELAARLALTLWSSVPDAALMQKAKSGALRDATVLEAEARRMLDDPRAVRVVDDFHRQWLTLDDLHFQKDAATFPGHDEAAFGDAAKRELLVFARHVALESDGAIADLFSTPLGYVDATLAPVYGVTGEFGGELVQTELNPEERSGLLTSAGFLASHADALDPSAIHRGVFVQKQVLCTVYGQLPADVGSLPPRSADIVTSRDRVEAKTSGAGCQSCHNTINPAGFAFERYDALGRVRTSDNGAPIDATSTLLLDGELQSFDGPVEFSHLLAESPTAKRCYETQWFRYALGRGESSEDACLLHAIDQRAQESNYNVKEMLVALTLSRGFRFRAQEEL